MFRKVLSYCEQSNQKYRDNLYQKLLILFEKDLSPDLEDKIIKPEFNIYYKNKILQLIQTESENGYEKIVKNNFPLEILFRRTALIDAVTMFSFACAVRQFNVKNKCSLKPENLPFTLIARGGYGRREMFPLSDVDLALASDHQPDHEKTVKEIIHNFEYLFIHQNIFLTSGSFGYMKISKIGMPESKKDIHDFRSLLESRFLCGNENVYNLFQEKIYAILESNKPFFIEDNNIYKESYTIENTVFQQEPDVKNDIRRFYWALFLTKIKFNYKESSMTGILNKLLEKEQISEQIYIRDQRALNFLIKVRLLLHLIQPSANKDKISFENREKIANAMGLELNDFYKEYFYHAALPLKIDGRNLFWHFMWRDEKVVKKLNSDFGENRNFTIVFLPEKENALSQTPKKIFDVMKFVAQKGYNISYPVILSIEKNIDNLVPIFINSETKGKINKTFQKILKGKYFAKAIRNMHEFGLISNFIIPEFSRLCGLLQDIYVHRFPVDTHIMAALDALNMLELEEGDTFLVQLYKNLKNSNLLKIATLLHDIGKGYKTESRNMGENEIGESMIPSILKGIGIVNKEDINSVQFLVGKHLAMKDLLDLDPSDSETYELIWKLIDRDMEKLRMLILLTFVDRFGTKMKMTSGQIASLKYIYQRTLYYERKETVDDSLKLEFIKLIDLPPYLQTQLDTYNDYKQSKNHFAMEIYYVEERPADLILCLNDQPQILYRIASIIAFNKLNIIDAQINTGNNVALDIFRLNNINGELIDYTNFYYMQRSLKEDIEKVFVKGFSVTDIYKNKVLVESNTKKKYKNISLKIRIIGRAIKIITPDILGIFMQTTKTFASMNIPINRAIFHCRNQYANNVFYLNNEDISKISSNIDGFSRRLSEELNKLVVSEAIF